MRGEDGGRRGRRGRRYGRAGRGSSKERSQVHITTERSSKVVRKDKEMRRIIRCGGKEDGGGIGMR